jgi:hypothetical protein
MHDVKETFPAALQYQMHTAMLTKLTQANITNLCQASFMNYALGHSNAEEILRIAKSFCFDTDTYSVDTNTQSFLRKVSFHFFVEKRKISFSYSNANNVECKMEFENQDLIWSLKNLTYFLNVSALNRVAKALDCPLSHDDLIHILLFAVESELFAKEQAQKILASK